MYSESRKIHIIEEVLKINNEDSLSKLEAVLRSLKSPPISSVKEFDQFVGVWTPEEADEITEIIEQSCETIHPDDWK
jgi:hypothetical protein